MAKLKPITARKTVQKLKRAGFIESHQRGSHLHLVKGSLVVTVPMHSSKDIPIGTLYNIVVRQAKILVNEFNNL